MKLSIITINLNNNLGLHKTILSVINQKYTHNYEFIIIDGGSTDESLNTILSYSQDLTHWVSEPDNGIYHAMNKGIAKAKGEYCLFLNSGDYLVEGILKNLSFINFKEGIIYGNIIIAKNGLQTRQTGAGRSDLTFYDFYAGASISHQAAFIKRELFDSYGLYDESIKIVSDWLFFLKTIIIHNVSVKYVNIDIAYFEPNGIGSTDIEQISKEREIILNTILPCKVIEDYQAYKKVIESNKRLTDTLEMYLNRYERFDRLIKLSRKIKRKLNLYKMFNAKY